MGVPDRRKKETPRLAFHDLTEGANGSKPTLPGNSTVHSSPLAQELVISRNIRFASLLDEPPSLFLPDGIHLVLRECVIEQIGVISWRHAFIHLRLRADRGRGGAMLGVSRSARWDWRR